MGNPTAGESRWHRVRIVAAAGAATALSVSEALALPSLTQGMLGPDGGIDGLTVVLGVVISLLATALVLMRIRARSDEASQALRVVLSDTRARLDRAEALLAADRQMIIVFGAPHEEPEITGDLSARTSIPVGRRALAFGSWVAHDQTQVLEEQVEKLRKSGLSFETQVRTRRGEHVAIDGRAVGGRAVLRLRDITGDRRALIKLEEEHASLTAEMTRVKALLDALPQPAWLRDATGRLVWANAAFRRGVESRDGAAEPAELLDQSVRDEAASARAAGRVFRRTVPAVAAGQRRMFDVVEAPHGGGSAGIAVDVSELEDVRADLVRRIEAHRKTLDELATGVAIFHADGRLAFHNQAYRVLWKLDPAFLDQEPTDSAILDRLRADHLLPEQVDFRSWKAQFHEAYRSVDPREHWWHLPDGRTMRVVQTPNPEGGVTYLFDDVSERMDLESRYNSLIRVQTETLDHLRDGVAVFGSNGRLRLHNPAFTRLWKLSEDELAKSPHADNVFTACAALHAADEPWTSLKTAVTALPEGRAPLAVRIERTDGAVIDIATVPLPDGATLTTFSEVTAGVAVERALTERNEALEAAGQLKSEFVKHVSYELRSPLTNIIGFTQLLGDPGTGPLTERQQEYAGHILASSAALYAIINDILDLATIDAGAMELELCEIDVRATIDAAAEGVRDRLAEHGLTLDILAPRDIGQFVADEKRIRQVLFNLLSNAIGFSPPGATVTLSATRRSDAVVFQVVDQGRGMEADLAERIFDRFESHTEGTTHRGVGLGLSIVRSLVELHGGTVDVATAPGRGTIVSCRFPIEGGAARQAAE